MSFDYTDAVLDRLEATITADRLSTYLTMAAVDKRSTLLLYVRNTSLSEAFYAPLQGVEIAVRNALHRQLTEAFGESWYDLSSLHLEFAQREKIAMARQKLQHVGKTIQPSNMVPELSFGFWTGILGRKYENSLWRPYLRNAFANARKPLLRKSAHAALDQIRHLRNRIAHHEPILSRDLRADHNCILEVIRWICADTAAWIAHHSHFETVHSNRPATHPRQ